MHGEGRQIDRRGLRRTPYRRPGVVDAHLRRDIGENESEVGDVEQYQEADDERNADALEAVLEQALGAAPAIEHRREQAREYKEDWYAEDMQEGDQEIGEGAVGRVLVGPDVA